jgi:hypothetical protein
MTKNNSDIIDEQNSQTKYHYFEDIMQNIEKSSGEIVYFQSPYRSV